MTGYVQKLQGNLHCEFFAWCKQEGIKELKYCLSDSHISPSSCKVIFNTKTM